MSGCPFGSSNDERCSGVLRRQNGSGRPFDWTGPTTERSAGMQQAVFAIHKPMFNSTKSKTYRLPLHDHFLVDLDQLNIVDSFCSVEYRSLYILQKLSLI